METPLQIPYPFFVSGLRVMTLRVCNQSFSYGAYFLSRMWQAGLDRSGSLSGMRISRGREGCLGATDAVHGGRFHQ